MPAHPPAPRRAAATVLALALGLLALTGCKGTNYQSLVIVQFNPNLAYDIGLHVKVKDACEHLPGVQALPLNKVIANDVVFSIAKASIHQQHALYLCLSRQPGVIGENTSSTDDGD